jgi:hypothetical protein
MIANPKSTKDAPADPQHIENAETPQFSFPMEFATMLHKGFERFADIQKSALDMYARQAEDAGNFWKQAFPAAPAATGTFIGDAAAQNVGRLIEVQKGVVDMMVKQSSAGVEALKERSAAASKAAGGAAGLMRDVVDCSVATQKIMLDFAAQQNKVVTDAMKQQPGAAGTPVFAAADAIKRSVDTAIETQRQVLDLAVKPMEAKKAEA